MKIIQVIGSFSRGDAIGNHIWELHKIFEKQGIDSEIYSQFRNENQDTSMIKNILELKHVCKEDIIILHMCIGSMVNKYVLQFRCKKVMMYHNITPPEFLKNYDLNFYRICKQGYKELRQLAGKFDTVIAMSEYNKRDLIKAGYKEPIEVWPGYLIPYDDYKQEPDASILDKYKDGKKNFLFVGRVVPNKKHEDIIQTFAYYKKHIDSNVRLILVGNTGLKTYVDDLKKYVEAIGVEDVIFTGSVSFPEIIAYYKVADVFLCMSEHEGFCVPLIEAMMFQVPIVAYAAAAVPETLRESGILVNKKKPEIVAKSIEIIEREEKNELIFNQSRRLEKIILEIQCIDYKKIWMKKFAKKRGKQ